MDKEKRLEKLIGNLLGIIDKADDEFYDEVRKIERKMLASVYAIIDRFSTSGGKIDRKGKSNKKLLVELNRRIKSILKNTKLRSATKRFLRNFDEVERINGQIHKLTNDIDISKLNLSQDKILAVEGIVGGLLNETTLNKQIAKPIRKILYRHVSSGTDVVTARRELKDWIQGDKAGRGSISRYVKTLAQETLSQYDGMVNKRIIEDFDFKHFRFIGSLISTSAPQCIEMVDGKGELGALRQEDGTYKVSDIPKIVRILKTKHKGVNKLLNKDNYVVLRNHWGCRHYILGAVSLEEDEQ